MGKSDAQRRSKRCWTKSDTNEARVEVRWDPPVIQGPRPFDHDIRRLSRIPKPGSAMYFALRDAASDNHLASWMLQDALAELSPYQ